jgi:hypothetical protein
LKQPHQHYLSGTPFNYQKTTPFNYQSYTRRSEQNISKTVVYEGRVAFMIMPKLDIS